MQKKCSLINSCKTLQKLCEKLTKYLTFFIPQRTRGFPHQDVHFQDSMTKRIKTTILQSWALHSFEWDHCSVEFEHIGLGKKCFVWGKKRWTPSSPASHCKYHLERPCDSPLNTCRCKFTKQNKLHISTLYLPLSSSERGMMLATFSCCRMVGNALESDHSDHYQCLGAMFV